MSEVVKIYGLDFALINKAAGLGVQYINRFRDVGSGIEPPIPPAPGNRDIRDIDVYNTSYGSDATFKLYGLEFSSDGTSWTDHTESPDWVVLDHPTQDPPSWNSGDESWDFLLGSGESVTLDADDSWTADYKPILARFSWGLDPEESASIDRVTIRSGNYATIGRFSANEDHAIETPICVALDFGVLYKFTKDTFWDLYTGSWDSPNRRWKTEPDGTSVSMGGLDWTDFWRATQMRVVAGAADITAISVMDFSSNAVFSYSGPAVQVVTMSGIWGGIDSSHSLYYMDITGNADFKIIDVSFSKDPYDYGSAWYLTYLDGDPLTSGRFRRRNVIEPADTWWAGFRPTQIRITIEDNGVDYIAIIDTNEPFANIIGGDDSTPRGIGVHTFNLDFNTYDLDISAILISTNTGGITKISNIEFNDGGWVSYLSPNYWVVANTSYQTWE